MFSESLQKLADVHRGVCVVGAGQPGRAASISDFSITQRSMRKGKPMHSKTQCMHSTFPGCRLPPERLPSYHHGVWILVRDHTFIPSWPQLLSAAYSAA